HSTIACTFFGSIQTLVVVPCFPKFLLLCGKTCFFSSSNANQLCMSVFQAASEHLFYVSQHPYLHGNVVQIKLQSQKPQQSLHMSLHMSCHDFETIRYRCKHQTSTDIPSSKMPV